MRFPIDTSGLRFVVVGPGEPLRRYDADRPNGDWPMCRDQDGEVLWRVPLVAFDDGDEVVLPVTVSGDPELQVGTTVKVDELTARTWKHDGHPGVTLCARAINRRAELAVVTSR